MSSPEVAARWRLSERGRWWFDVALATLLAVPVVAFPVSGVPWTWTALGAGHVLPLFWRRRHPVAVAAVVCATCALQLVLLDVPVYSDVAVPVATWSVARFAPWRPAAVVLGAGLVGAVLAPWDWLGPLGGSTPSGYVAYSLTLAAVVVTPWALGTAGRSRERFVDSLVERGERIEREAEQQVRLAAIEERTRIAREMHDVVAHGLSVIVVQADGARYAAARDPEVAPAALATIAETGRESLTEMRRLLGLLRADDTGAAPQPGLPDIEALVAEAREQGTVHVTLPEPGVVTVPAGVALTAYRVAQEALSNVRRHAGPATTTVTVSVDDAVTVVVEDDGHGAAASTDGRGLGLVGMRERVEVHEGTLDVGPRPGGGFRVRARIPL